jgi:hypothetical protein
LAIEALGIGAEPGFLRVDRAGIAIYALQNGIHCLPKRLSLRPENAAAMEKYGGMFLFAL